ncbi:hypothetical protein [Listeria riparia]|uniref:baeRF3 domain-containing protein n=1 Tax=Listeria riparia TaxID=1494964 RepID=UPI0004BC444C|nr:hypothetical protein [Listeria riparia]
MNYAEISRINSFAHTPSVTVTMQTHRDFNSYENDRLTLKNLLKDVKERLLKDYEWREIEQLLKYIEEAEDHYDPSTNLDTAIFFISNVIFNEVKLPIMVQQNTISIGPHFETKKILRAIQQVEHYYVLALSRDEVRLVECLNDKPLLEIKNHDFPARNHIFQTHNIERYTMGHKNNYIKEFFKTVDYTLQKQLNQNPLPIVLAGVDRNIAFFKEIASKNDRFIGELLGGFITENGVDVLDIAKKAYPIVQKYIEEGHEDALNKLQTAESGSRLQVDLNAVYRSAIEGRLQTLFVEKDYYEAAEIEDHSVRIGSSVRESEYYVDDVVHVIIYHTLKYGGEVHFLPNDMIAKYGRLAATTRY